MDDLPIIELPEHYHIDERKIGMALAHVSAQANSIAEHQAQLQHRLSLHEAEQQRFVEERVAATREEAEARNNALVLAIQQTYGDPSALEHRVDTRIQDVLQQLQNGAQEQARKYAEAQIADQAAFNALVEQRIYTALQDFEQEINTRVDKRIEDLRRHCCDYVEDQLKVASQRAEDARALVNDELDRYRSMQRTSIARSEARIAELVRCILDQHTTSARMRQQQEREALTDHFEERIRQVVAIAKTVAKSKAHELLTLRRALLGRALLRERRRMFLCIL